MRAVMDAQALGFRDETLSGVIAMFVLFHLPDPADGIAEIRRVLRPGGVCAFTTWGQDDEGFTAFDVFDEVLGRHGAGPGRELFARYEQLDTPDKCRDGLEATGFTNSSVRAERMAYRFSIDDLIGMRTTFGYGRVKWATVPEDRREAALRESRQAVARLSTEDLTLRDEVIYATGITS